MKKWDEIRSAEDFGVAFTAQQHEMINGSLLPNDELDARYGINYARYDRDDHCLQTSFNVLDGQGPAGLLREKIANLDRPVDILDYGVSTGTQLVSVLDGQTYPRNPAVGLEEVRPVVASGMDLSGQAHNWKTRFAVALGLVQYEAIELSQPRSLGNKKYDIIYSFDALGDVQEPQLLLSGLYSLLRRGGSLYANVFAGQQEKMLATAANLSQKSRAHVSFYWHDYPPEFWPEPETSPLSLKLTKRNDASL